MSVFTIVTPEQLSVWLKRYALGSLRELKGIAAGIENTNYFVTTSAGRYVLTLFEKLTARDLPFYLNLMAHLARHGIPCPQPIADHHNEYLGEVNGKPASLVSCVSGADVSAVNARHCSTIGALLAEMHLAGKSYSARMPNPRGPGWWSDAFPRVAPFLSADAAALLQREIAFQANCDHHDLPQGVIHADLFRDNVLWDGARVGGIIDFYFACNDALLYDVAITANDWCVTPEGRLDEERVTSLLEAYHEIRPFTAAERQAWPTLLRAAALRFWISRLYDFHLPRPGALTHAKDPHHFQRILQWHVARETAAEIAFVQ